MIYILFIAGFIILIIGAGILVDGAGSIGKKLNMSSIVIGFTIVALGTSLPELIINVFASLRGESELAITNVLGSNIMNTLFILGAAAFIFPIKPEKKTVITLVPISLIAASALALFANTQWFSKDKTAFIDRPEGILLLILLITYLVFSWWFSRKESVNDTDEIKSFSTPASLGRILLGMAGLYFGGNWVVDGAIEIATDFGISRAVVGTTIVAAATSLPELVTSVIAALKKNSGIALGNALGSNIFNVFLVLGTSALISPLPFNEALNIDVGMMVFSNLIIVFFIYFGKGKTITRNEGIWIMLFYIAYITSLVIRN